VTATSGQKSKIGRSITLIVFVAMLLALGFSAEAQQPKKVPRIGYLSPLSLLSESTRAEEIRLELHEVGYIEGEKIAIEYRYAEDRTAKNHKNNKPRDKVTAL